MHKNVRISENFDMNKKFEFSVLKYYNQENVVYFTTMIRFY